MKEPEPFSLALSANLIERAGSRVATDSSLFGICAIVWVTVNEGSVQGRSTGVPFFFQPKVRARTASSAGLLLNIIRYENELRKADKYFADLDAVKFDPELVNLASALVERSSERFKDAYADELRKLVEKKAKGQKIEIPQTDKPEPSNVVNLMDALKKSLKGGEDKQVKPARKRKSARS